MSVVFSGSNLLLLLRDFDMVCVCHFIKRTALFLGTVTGTLQILIGVDRQSYSHVITITFLDTRLPHYGKLTLHEIKVLEIDVNLVENNFQISK